jgi:hypothetical protein
MAGVSRQVLQELRRRHQAGLMAVATELTNRAKTLATQHTDNGTRRNSITQTPHVDGRTVLWGIPQASAPHAPYLEAGFRPHWVPARHIGVWMQRHGVGILRHGKAVRVSDRRKRINLRARGTSVALGVFVGGPGSTLQTAPGGTKARFFAGRGRFRTWHYHTKGGTSRYLRTGTVGHPILQPVAAQAHTVPLEVFVRGATRA